MKALLCAITAVSVALSVPARAAESAQSELKNLVGTINARLNSSREVTEEALAPDLKEFDAIVARHSGEKSDAVAEVLLMKALLYLEVLDDPAKAGETFQELQAKFPGTKPAEAAGQILPQIKKMEAAKKIQAALKVGMQFPDFHEQDLTGNPISVSALKGKVVLIDFWATWCMPCVAELPDIRAAYEKYRGKGFDIIGVSLDEDKATLLRFLKKNKVAWPQYFDGRGFENELAVKYGILAIPATFLLDKEGHILAKNLRGEELEEAVAKALGD